MISRKQMFIFSEIPKPGSTSMLAVLGKYADFSCPKHTDLSEIVQVVNKTNFYKMFKFTFVRNPWCRTVSMYFRNEGIIKRNDMSFREFVNWIKMSTDTCTMPSPKKYQLDFVKLNGKSVADFIGRFENLQEDFNTVCDKTGIPRQALPMKNKSKHNHYTEYYDDETREIIAKKFREDIEYFGYKFGE
mgnify:CR=1 FL=1